MSTNIWQNGGTDNNWSTANNWSLAHKPAAGEDVTIAAAYNCVVNEATNALNSLNMTGYANTLSGASNITVGTSGSGTVSCKIAGTISWTGYLLLNPISAGDIIEVTTNSKTLRKITVGATTSAGSVYLLDNTSVTGINVELISGELHTDGASDSSGLSHTWRGFFNSSSSTCALNLGSSNITGTINASTGMAWRMDNANVTLSATLSTINITGSGSSGLEHARFGAVNGSVYGIVNFTGAGIHRVRAGAGVTIETLTMTGTNAYTDGLMLYTELTVSDTLTLTGNSAAKRLLINSTSFASAIVLTITGADISGCNNVDFQDITFANGGSNVDFSGVSSGNCGGNTISGGGTLSFTATADQHWLTAAGGNWYDSANWTSRVPLPQDNVYFNLAFNSSVTVTANMPRLGKNIDWSGASVASGNLPTMALGNEVYIYGNLDLTNCYSMTGAYSFYFEGRSNCTVKMAGKSFPSLMWLKTAGATLTMQDALVCASGIITQCGTFTTGNYNLTAASYSYASAIPNDAMTSNWGTSLVTLTNTGIGVQALFLQPNRTCNMSNSTLLSTTNQTAEINPTSVSGGAVFGNINITPGTGNFSFTGSSFSVANMIMASAGTRTVIFKNGTTVTLTGTTFLSGTSGNLITITSATGGSSFTLTKASGTVVCGYLSIQDCSATGANWYDKFGVNVSGNTGWRFTQTRFMMF